jgi:serine/threonine protein kinase
MKESDGYT